MRVEVWSDVVCPWCYVAKRRLEAALARFPRAADVEVVWRSFELDPGAPSSDGVGLVEHLAAKYRVSLDEARAMNDRVTEVAAGEGLAFRLDLARRGNTFDAHRLVHLAAASGLHDAMQERLMAAYFTEGEPVADHDALARQAQAVGLDQAAVRRVLAGDDHAGEVRADEAEARRLGVTSVPFFVVDRRYGIAGAQPADVLLGALRRAWAERRPLQSVPAPGPAGDER